MKKYQLFDEFNKGTLFGETLADAIMHGTIKTAGMYNRESQKVTGSSEIKIKNILGYIDTSQSRRGLTKYESVLIETEDGQRMAIDAWYVGEIITP